MTVPYEDRSPASTRSPSVAMFLVVAARHLPATSETYHEVGGDCLSRPRQTHNRDRATPLRQLERRLGHQDAHPPNDLSRHEGAPDPSAGLQETSTAAAGSTGWRLPPVKGPDRTRRPRG
jgi:hypothetical protein